MEETSVATLAGAAGDWGVSQTSIESGGGFEPFVDEKGNSVATPGHQRAPEHRPRRRGASGCEQDPWAGAEAPAPSWTGATEPSLGEGSGGTLSSLGDDEGSAEVDTMLIDRHRVDCGDVTSLADVHGDPPH